MSFPVPKGGSPSTPGDVDGHPGGLHDDHGVSGLSGTPACSIPAPYCPDMVVVPGLGQQLLGLRAHLDAVATGAALVVVIHGEPGTGRTHAIKRLAGMAAGTGLRVARVRAAPHDSEIPYAVAAALGESLDTKVSSSGSDEPEDIAEVAARLLEAASLSNDVAGSCLLVDDASWADEASLRVLLHAAQRLSGRGVAVVVATGPESPSARTVRLLDELRASPDAVLVRLGPLESVEATALIDASLGRRADSCVHAPVLRRTGANPFLLTSLLDDLARTPAAEELAIEESVPDRVVATVSARLTRLGPDAVALARAVHVLAGEASLSRAATLAELDRRSAEDAADGLARIGVLRPGVPLAYAQPLVDAAVGIGIEPFALDRLHRRAAALLVAELACPTRVVPHLLRTTPSAEPWVVEQLRAAADQATGSGDCATAATLLRRAVVEPPAEDVVPAVLSELAFAESRAGLPEATSTIEAALGAVTSRDERLMLLRERTRLLWLTGHLPAAVDASETALTHTEPDTLLHEELLAELLAVASMHDLAPIYARPRLVELLERANAGWVPDSAPLAATLATVLPFVLGDHRLVGPLVDRALQEDLWRVDAPPFGMRPDFVIGSLWLSGGLDRGTRIIREGMASVDQENLFRHGLLWYWLGEIRYAAGDLTGTIEAASTALEPRWGAFLSWFGFSSATLAHTYLDLGDHSRAEEVLSATDGRLDPQQLYGIAVDLAKARLMVRTGRPEEATALTASVAERLGELGHRDSPQIVWRCIAAKAAIESNDLASAHVLIDEEIELAETTHAARRLGRALRLLARITDRPERLPILRRSVEVLRLTEHRLAHARALRDLGLELHEAGDVPGARASLTEARELAEACGAGPVANGALTGLHATGARPRRTARSGVDSLTATERRVVDLAAEGRTNRDIGDSLGIASRTVEWHLRGAFAKLGVRSRRDLGGVLTTRAE